MEEIIRLVAAMDGGEWEEELLQTMCRTARESLLSRLRPGIAPEDCGGAFPVAAAWLALEGLYESGGGVESFSAGDLTVRTGGAQRGKGLGQQAWRLMAPYCRDTNFAFRRAKG